MTQQDVSRVARENIEAFNANDMARMRSTMAEDTVYEEYATQRRIQGSAEVLKAMQGWRSAFPDAKGVIRSMVASGNTVVAEITWEGTHRGALAAGAGTIPASGKRVKVQAVEVYTVQAGKVKEARHYFDMMTLLQQLGAAPKS